MGDHVGVGTYVNTCRDCHYCNEGLENHCQKGLVFTFNHVDADGTITKGGYSSFIVVHQRSYYLSLSLIFLLCFFHKTWPFIISCFKYTNKHMHGSISLISFIDEYLSSGLDLQILLQDS